MTVVIAVDAMGGDHAPFIVLEGVCSVLKTHPSVHFLLFGDEAAIQRHLKTPHKNCEIIHTDEVVTNTTPTRDALRTLKRSSMRMAIEAVKDGRAQGCVSAGNTGAYMALAKIILKTLPGIDRPAITASLPSAKGTTVMLDLGANAEVSALNLVQFAIMGQAFARGVLDIKNPTVGLLNIGSEDLKGNTIVKEAQDLLRQHHCIPNYHGFVEGDDIFLGTTDVVVSDGFSGNIALKTAEGTTKFFASELRAAFARSFLSKFAYLLVRPIFNRFKTRLDPRGYNGAPFLGLRGIAVKSHGGTDALGFASALKVAINMVKNNINERISEELLKIQELTPEPKQALSPLDGETL